MSMEKFAFRVIAALVLIAALIAAAYVARLLTVGGKTIYELLGENKALHQAIANLTSESPIGRAQVLKKEVRDGVTYTTIRFAETDRDDPTRRVFQRDMEVRGDVVHFDALVIRFNKEYVADGRARALYLWRRVYSDEMRPEDGVPIEEIGEEPARYREIFKILEPSDRELFWQEIWSLADDAERLRTAGVVAVHGKVVYTRLEKGIIYTLTITNTGDLNIDKTPILDAP